MASAAARFARRAATKPQYLLHPQRLVRRALRPLLSDPDQELVEVELGWGLPLRVHSREAIGYSIRTVGVFDPCVSEALHRLIAAGDVVVDVGANVGYMTSIMVQATGPTGAVTAYEPHPRVYEVLAQNVQLWQTRGPCPVTAVRLAISNRRGTGTLSEGSSFRQNMGTARLTEGDASPADMDIEVECLDELLGEREIGLLKVDVEGAEPAVFEGAEILLRRQRIRDIVFEDHGRYPTAASSVLERHGYTVAALDNSLFKVRLRRPTEVRAAPAWPGQSFLATLDIDRAARRFESTGWSLPGIEPEWLSLARRVVRR